MIPTASLFVISVSKPPMLKTSEPNYTIDVVNPTNGVPANGGRLWIEVVLRPVEARN